MAALDAVDRIMKNSARSRASAVEIKLDPEYTFIRGAPSETKQKPVLVSGTVTVNVPQRIAVKGIRISLVGQRKTVRFRPRLAGQSNAVAPIEAIDNFFHEEKHLGRPNGDAIRFLDHGANVFDFLWTLPGDCPDTVVGLGASQIRYDMKAHVERGMFGQNLKGKKHIRIIRTLHPDSMAMQDPNSTESQWVQKGVKYSLATRAQAAALGDVLPVEFKLTQFDSTKVAINECEIVLKETQRVRTKATPDFPDPIEEKETTIKRAVVRVPQDYQGQDPITGDPRKEFTYDFHLPASLNECRQSVPEGHWIQISHKIYCYINLINPDGHVSRVQPAFDTHLFIAEQRPVSESNTIINSLPASPVEPGAQNSLMAYFQEPPPNYHTRHLDRLYEDVPEAESGINTPMPLSGGATPGMMTPGVASGYRDSRRGSADAAMIQQLQNGLDDHSADLASRLRGLQASERSMNAGLSPSSRNNSYLGLSHMGQHSNLLNHYNMDELERLESYETALRTPARGSADVPPSYVEATSRPPSPDRSGDAHA